MAEKKNDYLAACRVFGISGLLSSSFLPHRTQATEEAVYKGSPWSFATSVVSCNKGATTP
eukprot:14931790-Ditylum_brightwellii.AAC.1